MQRYVLEVMYDGTQFHGSQVQGETPTVQRALNIALATLLRTPIQTFGASRTDEGVHALSNFYHFDLEEEFQFDLHYKLNAVLPGGVAVKQIYKAGNEFNARFEAISRRYRYRVYHHKNPFLLNRALYHPLKLHRDILESLAPIIMEYGQFESFAKRHGQSKTHNCQIMQSHWEDHGAELHYVVEANRFLRGMVRGLVGTQLHIARAGGTRDDLRKIIELRNCTKAFFNVPGHGLYLEEVKYKEGVLMPL
jgi:tRNA pseudouridine38-40 synthase